MHFASVLFVLLVATLASSMQITRSSLQHGQSSNDFSDSENQESEFAVNSGGLDDYGPGKKNDLENKPRKISATNEVQEPLLTKAEFVYNGGKQFRRQVSSSDESVASGEIFHEEPKEAERELFTPLLGTIVLSFPKHRSRGYPKDAAEDEPSADNIARTAGEDEPHGTSTNSIDKGDLDDVDRLPDEKYPKQDVDSQTGGNLVRVRRGVILPPAIKTIPEVLNMGRGRCRYPKRLDRGHVICRPVW